MAGRIPQSFIDDLLIRVDIVDIIDSRVPLKKTGREYQACCPFHSEKTPSFTVSPQKQFYHCFGCGVHGSAIGFLMEHDNLSFVEAVEALAAKLNIDIPYEQSGGYGGQKSKAQQENSKNIYDILEQANQHYRGLLVNHPDANKAIKYLKKRGITGQTAQRFELGLAPNAWDSCYKKLGNNGANVKLLNQAGLIIQRQQNNDNASKVKGQQPSNNNQNARQTGFYDRFRHRIMFPIKDSRQRTIGFGGRVIDNSEPKYLNSPETPVYHKGRELYGLHLAANSIKSQACVLVVEGYMDVIMLSQHGVENCVATLGTAMTVSHVERLFKLTDEIICCFDGDRAGTQAAWRALENVVGSIHGKRNIKFLFLPQGEDPDSLINKEGKEAFLKRLDEALSFSQMLVSRVKSNSNAGSDTRLSLAAEVIPYIEKINDGMIKDVLKQELARYAGSDVLHQLETKTISKMPSSSNNRYGNNKFGGAKSFYQNNNNTNASWSNNSASYQGGNTNTLSTPPNLASQSQGSQNTENSQRGRYYVFASRAVQLLLQYPSFCRKVANNDIDFLATLNDQTVNLLIDLHHQIRLDKSGRELNTGMILERYREQPYHKLLDRLASQSYLIEDEEQLAHEFVHSINALLYQSIDKEISELIEMESKTGSDEYILEQRKKLYEKRNEIKQKWLN